MAVTKGLHMLAHKGGATAPLIAEVLINAGAGLSLRDAVAKTRHDDTLILSIVVMASQTDSLGVVCT